MEQSIVKQVKQVENVNDFFPKFIFQDNNLNIIVKVKYFTKKCDYTKLSKFIFNLVDKVISERMIKLDIDVLDILIDLKDYKIKEIDYAFIKLMIALCQENYKDNLRIIYLKNSNIMFKTIYAVVRPFVDKETRKKIFFIKKGKKNKITEENIDELFE